jgi:hypothetical protein
MIRLWTSIDRRLRLAVVMLGLALTPIAWYLGSPLFINKTVNESFPFSAPATQSQPAATVIAAMPAAQSQPAATAMAAMPAAQSQPISTPVVPSAPVALSSGQFGAIDVIHKGQGTATFYKLPDGKRVLRFEEFKVQNGPDLYVYLSGHPAPRDDGQVRQDGFEVARLKGNIGDQNYELPDDLDLSKIKSVVIYCRRFSEVFSTAELKLGS